MEIPPGSLHWNLKKAPGRIFVKCSSKDSQDWVEFSAITLPGFGNVKAADFVNKFLKNQRFDGKKQIEFKFRF